MTPRSTETAWATAKRRVYRGEEGGDDGGRVGGLRWRPGRVEQGVPGKGQVWPAQVASLVFEAVPGGSVSGACPG